MHKPSLRLLLPVLGVFSWPSLAWPCPHATAELAQVGESTRPPTPPARPHVPFPPTMPSVEANPRPKPRFRLPSFTPNPKRPQGPVEPSTVRPNPDFLPGSGSDIRVVVNQGLVHFDVPPRLEGGTVLVPLRGVFEKLGAQVRYDASTGRIEARRKGTLVRLRVADTLAEVDGRKVVMLWPAQASGKRTLVPLRFVSEALGAHVEFNPARRTVLVQMEQGSL